MEDRYQKRVDEMGNPMACHSCGFKNVATAEYPHRIELGRSEAFNIANLDKPKLLCQLCAGTMTGNALDYPSQYPNADVLKTICYVGNAILAKLEH